MKGNKKKGSAWGGAKAATRWFGILALVFGLVLAGCDDPNSGGKKTDDKELAGTIKIQKGGSDVTAATTGDTLTAVYSGSETGITYQWNKDSVPVSSGGTGSAYAPSETGSYTVTVSKSGYQSKTSAAVTVSAPTDPVWTAANTADSGFRNNTNIDDVAYNGIDKWVAVAGYNIATSSDGVNWMAVTQNLSSSINGVAYGDNKWVAVGQGGQIATSTNNGETWASVATTIFSSSNISGVAYGGSGTTARFIAVGSYYKIAYSSDGTNWQMATITGGPSSVSDTEGFSRVAYGDGTWVAIGSGCRTATSTDNGITWTVTTQNFSTSIFDVAYGNGQFVAVGSEGKIAYSSDGTTWQTATSSFNSTTGIRGVAYGNSKWVAVGYDSAQQKGRIAASENGIDWAAEEQNIFSGSYIYINRVAYGNGNGKWVAVGMGKIAYLADDN